MDPRSSPTWDHLNWHPVRVWVGLASIWPMWDLWHLPLALPKAHEAETGSISLARAGSTPGKTPQQIQQFKLWNPSWAHILCKYNFWHCFVVRSCGIMGWEEAANAVSETGLLSKWSWKVRKLFIPGCVNRTGNWDVSLYGIIVLCPLTVKMAHGWVAFKPSPGCLVSALICQGQMRWTAQFGKYKQFRRS